MANQREVLSQFKAAKGREVESNKALYDIPTKSYCCHMSTNATTMRLSCPLHAFLFQSWTATKNLKLSQITISIKEELTLLMKIVKNSVA